MNYINPNYINPFKLFGIDYKNIDDKELKKKYYELSLLCHPDKGGNKEDMNVIVNAYNYIKLQTENCKNIDSYEKMEQDFEDFCKTQEMKTPVFYEIYKESDDYKRNIEFNKQFENIKCMRSKCVQDVINRDGMDNLNEPSPEYNQEQCPNLYENTSFNDNGYSEFMQSSEYNEENITYNPDINIEDGKKIPVDKQFPNIIKNQLTIYKELETNPIGYGDHFRFDIESTEDYSSQLDNINASDYKQAFTILGKENVDKYEIEEKTLEQLIKEREYLNNKY